MNRLVVSVARFRPHGQKRAEYMEEPPGISDTDAPQAGRVRFLGLAFDPLDHDMVVARLAARSPEDDFCYMVTPNVQHVVAADRAPGILPWLDGAWLSVCDSQPLRKLAAWQGLHLPLVTGSDLTVTLFQRVIAPGDRVAVICASDALAQALRTAYPLVDWAFHVPPRDTEPGTPAFADCVRFVAGTHARLFFVCLGAPKSEAICHAVSSEPGAKGTALCTGAAFEFMLGLKARAPVWVQRLGLEWLHRMLSEPHRLAGRYLSAMLPLLRIWLAERRLKSPQQPGPR